MIFLSRNNFSIKHFFFAYATVLKNHKRCQKNENLCVCVMNVKNY